MSTATYETLTRLADEFRVKHPDGMEPLTPAAGRALDNVLRDLDDDESHSLVMMGATGNWDWHMVDGSGRIWHFSVNGRTSWNMLNDSGERRIMEKAYALGWDDSRS